jgi:SAM-dependent methyltransferase
MQVSAQMAGSPPLPRAREQVLEHYRIEKELAGKLRDAPREARRRLYTEVYDELLERVPHHPLLNNRRTRADIERAVNNRIAYLAPYIDANSVFLDIGAGGCDLSMAIAPRVKRVIAIDVSNAITDHVKPAPNFALVISDGTSIPVPNGSIDVAFSDQLMEHLHPDDAAEQLREIHKALRPQGVYLCITPNRTSGPHDVSRGFDTVATGLHLHEYTVRELDELLKKVGFTRTQVVLPVGNVRIPLWIVTALEATLSILPGPLARKIAYFRPMRGFLGIRILARK